MTPDNQRIEEREEWSADGKTPVVTTYQIKEKPDGVEVWEIKSVKPWKPDKGGDK